MTKRANPIGIRCHRHRYPHGARKNRRIRLHLNVMKTISGSNIFTAVVVIVIVVILHGILANKAPKMILDYILYKFDIQIGKENHFNIKLSISLILSSTIFFTLYLCRPVRRQLKILEISIKKLEISIKKILKNK